MPHVKQLIEQELEDLLEVECRARDLVEEVEAEQARSKERGDKQPPFAPCTLEFVKQVKPHLQQLDETRLKKTA